MRTLFLLVVALVGCDLQPPPKKSPTTTTDMPAPTADAGVAVDGAAAAPTDAFETSAECTQVGTRIAAALIEEAPDPAQKAALGQERDRIVRRTAEACTRDNWPPDARECFLKAKTTAEMQICGQNLAAPRE